MVDKTPLHLSYSFTKTKLLWDQLNEFFSNTALSIPFFIPKGAIIGHTDLSDDNLLTHSFPMHPFSTP